MHEKFGGAGRQQSTPDTSMKSPRTLFSSTIAADGQRRTTAKP